MAIGAVGILPSGTVLLWGSQITADVPETAVRAVRWPSLRKAAESAIVGGALIGVGCLAGYLLEGRRGYLYAGGAGISWVSLSASAISRSHRRNLA